MKHPQISAIESEWLESLAKACDPMPPWTPAKTKARHARDEYICDLYEKGIPVIAIADRASLSKHAILAIVRKARAAGRQVVRPRAKANSREPFRRTMTVTEIEYLTDLDARVPRQRGGRRFLFGPSGETLLAEMVRLRHDKVSLNELASLLGISRQAAHHMTKDRMTNVQA